MKISLEQSLLCSLILFSISSFLSVACANVFLGFSILLFFIVLYKKEYVDISVEYVRYLKAIGIFSLSLLISAVFSGDVFYGIKIWADFFLWRFMPFIVVLICFSKKEQINKLLYAILLGFSIDCICAIYQGIFVNQLNVAVKRAAGFVGHPMTLAGWACILLPVLLGFIFNKGNSKKYSLVYVVIFILGCIALIFNSTRGAWVALAVILPLISLSFLLDNKKSFIVLITIFLVIGGALSSNLSFIKRVNSITDFKNSSIVARFIIWDKAIGIFRDNPILGVGLGSFKTVYQSTFKEDKQLKKLHDEHIRYYVNKKQKKLTPYQKKLTKIQRQNNYRGFLEYRKQKNLKSLTHAHNNFIQMLAENGVVGFVGYIFAFGYILWRNIKNYFTNKNPYALMIAGSTGALVLQGLTEYNFGNGAVMKLYWLVLGCLVVLAGCYNKEKDCKKVE